MSDNSAENMLLKLFMIRDDIIQHIDSLLQLVDLISLDELQQKNFLECVSYLQNIKQSVLLLKQETNRLLDEDTTKQSIRTEHLSTDLSKIRHDLRNPVNAMQGYSEISLEEFQSAGDVDLIKKMEEIIALIRQVLYLIDEISVTNHSSHFSRSTGKQSSDIMQTTDTEELSFIGKEEPVEEYLKFKESIPVLVVDDIKENCQILSLYLNHIGYKNVEVAYNGHQALKMIDENEFSIVLLDIDMPEMTGIDILINIKRHARHRDIMVMMISAADTMENTIKCIKLGAEDFLPKPFNRDLLRVRMGACVEKKWFQNKELQYHKQLEIEKQRYEKLLNTILPPSIVVELATASKVKTRYYQNVAVLFADVVSFTKYCDTHGLPDVEENLQKFSELCEEIAIRYNLQKIKTIGDGFLATAGMLTDNKNPVLDCVDCAIELLTKSVEVLPAKWQLRAGVDFGSVIGGVIGHRQFLFDIWGDTVNTAARIQSAADPSTVFLTKHAWEQIQNQCEAVSLGNILLKGKTPMELFKYLGKKASRSAL